jgi:predicted DNA-binding transcriptional regulator AlpA
MSVDHSETTYSQQPPLIPKAWTYCGVSRAGYYRMMAADQAPKPVKLAFGRNLWRRADLDKWIASLKPRKALRPSRRTCPATESRR